MTPQEKLSMESDIGKLKLMAAVSLQMMDAYLKEVRDHVELAGGNAKQAFDHVKDSAELMEFAVNQVFDMAADLDRRFGG